GKRQSSRLTSGRAELGKGTGYLDGRQGFGLWRRRWSDQGVRFGHKSRTNEALGKSRQGIGGRPHPGREEARQSTRLGPGRNVGQDLGSRSRPDSAAVAGELADRGSCVQSRRQIPGNNLARGLGYNHRSAPGAIEGTFSSDSLIGLAAGWERFGD